MIVGHPVEAIATTMMWAAIVILRLNKQNPKDKPMSARENNLALRVKALIAPMQNPVRVLRRYPARVELRQKQRTEASEVEQVQAAPHRVARVNSAQTIQKAVALEIQAAVPLVVRVAASN